MDIEAKDLEQMENLFFQSVRGIHILFNHHKIAKVLQKAPLDENDFFSFENIEKAQKIVVELLNRKTLWEKQAYLDDLDTKTYELLLRTYFRLLENTLRVHHPWKH